MNPYPDRLEELHDWLERKYGQRDRQATEIILAALLPPDVTGMPRPWIIIETDWMRRETEEAWFSFGGVCAPKSMTEPRLLRREPQERMLQDWISTKRSGAAGVHVEAEWRRLPMAGRGASEMMITSYAVFNALNVRLRVEHPRGGQALQYNREADRIELGRLAKRVLNSEFRTHRNAPQFASVRPPEGLYYWAELAQRVAKRQGDWETLTGSVAGIANGIGCLRQGESDWEAGARVLRDCVPWLDQFIIRSVEKSYKQYVPPYMVFKQSGLGDCEKRAMAQEVRRLHNEGVFKARSDNAYKNGRHYYPWRYRVSHPDWLQLIDYTQPLFAPPGAPAAAVAK